MGPNVDGFGRLDVLLLDEAMAGGAINARRISTGDSFDFP